MTDAPEAHVAKVRMGLTASADVKATVQAWVDAGRPDGADGLRARLEAVADPKPVEQAVKAVRRAGAQSV